MATKTANVSAALNHVCELLDHDHANEALDFIDHFDVASPEIENARGVCLFRLGKHDEAISVLQNVAFRGNVQAPEDTPTLFLVNFATAMLLANHKGGAMAIVDRLRGDEHPEAARLSAAILKWRQSIGLLGRLRCYLGFYPAKPVLWDKPPGAV
jgi:hypothetical protein